MTSRLIRCLCRVSSRLLLFTSLLWIASPMVAQLPQITHFVAPQFPPLARRATVSGQVVLKATVGPTGKIVRVAAESSAHPLLTESATAAVNEWAFSSGGSGRIVTINVIYGFSGKVRAADPITTVGADFGNLAVRVYVTTDPYPMEHPADNVRDRL